MLAAVAAFADARVAVHTRDHDQAAALVERAFAPFSIRWYEAAVERWTSIDARFERACTLRLLPGREQEAADELRAIGCRP
ncbi:hypothetical protein [Nonomuraea rosea]|uniref:hypothetical protein n=1 Tax=Nonomuraea rosea TaxID=638574 RepID=UPI0031E5AF56